MAPNDLFQPCRDHGVLQAPWALEDLVRIFSAFDLIPSAYAFLPKDQPYSALIGNPAYRRLEKSVCQVMGLDASAGGLLLLNGMGTAISAALQGRAVQVPHPIRYGRNYPVDVNFVLQPVVHEVQGTLLGVLISVGEESIAFDNHFLARVQDSLKEMREAVLRLTRDKRGVEELLRAVMRESPFAIMLLDEGRNVLQINHACETMMGLSQRQIMGRNCQDLLECPARTAASCPILHGGEHLQLQETQVHGTRGVTPILRSAVKVELAGHPAVMEVFVDISQRKIAEAELRRLNEHMRLLLESTDEGIFGVDATRRCIFINPAAERMLGYGAGQLLGQDVCDLIHSRDEHGQSLDPDATQLMRAMQKGTPQHCQNGVFWPRKGHMLQVSYTASPIHKDGQVAGAVVVFRDIAAELEITRRLDYMASHDMLTGLVNRVEFKRRGEEMLALAKRDKIIYALLYIDLDQFKVVNDSCGHAAGDELLRQLTDMLREHVRRSDTLARLGGDEFGVLLENCDQPKALEVAGNLRQAVEEFRFTWEQKTFRVGASIGLVMLDAETPSFESAMSSADAACYHAKDLGRNRVSVHQLQDQDIVRRRGEAQWVSRLQRAMEQDRFVLFAQEIANLRPEAEQGHIHFEVLLRLQEERGKLIPPGAFLPAAERFNLMSQVDRLVISKTLAWLATNRDVFSRTPACCSINLSAQSLAHEGFLTFLLAEIDHFQVDPRMLCFEITETSVVTNMNAALRLIRALKEKGCQFALDDFGSGMSSFAYLKNLPVDYLKIDGNFVRHIDENPLDLAMVEAITKVGQLLNLQIIAEFAENEAVIRKLREVRADFAQGYGVAIPRPIDELLQVPLFVGSSSP